MKILVSTFGTEMRLRQDVWVEPAASTLHEVLRALRAQFALELGRFMRDDLSPTHGSAVLLNGRNILSLDPRGTPVHEGDELTFTVQVAGG